MSDPMAKAERSAAKDARQSPAPDRALHKKSGKKKAKPFELQHKYKEGREWRFFKDLKDWRKWDRYKDLDTAERAKAQLERKYDWYDWRIKPTGEPDAKPSVAGLCAKVDELLGESDERSTEDTVGTGRGQGGDGTDPVL